MDPERKKAINKLIKTEVMIRQVKRRSESFYKNKQLLDQLDNITNTFDKTYMVNSSAEKEFAKIDKFNKDFKNQKKKEFTMSDISINSPKLDLSRNIDLYDDSQFHPIGYRPPKSELTFNIFNGFDKTVNDIKKACKYIFIFSLILLVIFIIYKVVLYLKNKKLLFFAEKNEI